MIMALFIVLVVGLFAALWFFVGRHGDIPMHPRIVEIAERRDSNGASDA